MATHYPRRQFLNHLAALGAFATVSSYAGASGRNAPAAPETKAVPSGKGPSRSPAEKKFVPVMITPFKTDLTIDYHGVSALTDFYLSSGAKGLFANCLSSEMYHLSDDERLSLVGHIVKHVNGSVPVVATGSFGDDAGQQADFARRMHSTGVDGVILITSHFAKKDESDAVMMKNLDKFFALTQDIPLGTYECPSPYKRILTPETFGYITRSNRVIYHKDTTLDPPRIKEKLDICAGSRLEFYDAHAPNAVFSLRNGAKGLSCIAGNFYPEIFSWMCANANDPSKADDVQWLQNEITRMDDVISNGYSLSARYFLNKRGLKLQLASRAVKTALNAGQREVLDNTFRTVTGWHERLGIKA